MAPRLLFATAAPEVDEAKPLSAEQWRDIERAAWRAYDREVRERSGGRAPREDFDGEQIEEGEGDYDGAVERAEAGTGGAAAQVTAEREAEALRSSAERWSSHVLGALRRGAPLRLALQEGTRRADAEDEGQEPPEPEDYVDALFAASTVAPKRARILKVVPRPPVVADAPPAAPAERRFAWAVVSGARRRGLVSYRCAACGFTGTAYLSALRALPSDDQCPHEGRGPYRRKRT